MSKRILVSLFAFLLFNSAFSAEEATTKFTLQTDAFLDQGMLPVLYTCDGQNKSPEMDWINVPAKTVTFALIMSDPDAPNGTFYHWIVYNIPKSINKFDSGITKYPTGVMLGKNNFNKLSYDGPCPPKGATHNYIINLYALDTKLSLKEGASAKEVLAALQNHKVGEAKLSVVYSRWIQ